MKKLLIIGYLLNIAMAFSTDEGKRPERRYVRGPIREKLSAKLAERPSTQLIYLKEILKVENLLEQRDYESAKEILLALIDKIKDQKDSFSVDIIKLSSDHLYEIAMIHIPLLQDAPLELGQKIMKEYIDSNLELAATYGLKKAGAFRALMQASPEVEDDLNNCEALKTELEKYLDIDDPTMSIEIKHRLAYDYYSVSKKKRQKNAAHSIFAEMLQHSNPTIRLIGALGELKMAVRTGNKSSIIPALGLAKDKFKDRFKDLADLDIFATHIPHVQQYDFAIALYQFGDNQDAKLALDLLNKLDGQYWPAEYFLQEVRKTPKSRIAEISLESLPSDSLTKVLADPEAVPAAVSPKPQAPEAVSVAVSQKPQAHKKTTFEEKDGQDQEPLIRINDYFSLTNTAIKDLNKLSRNGKVSLPAEIQGIDVIAERISQIGIGGKYPTDLARKIIGTKGFYRSHLGHDYRMDWQRLTDAEGNKKIEIRHIGPKKTFSYQP